MSEQRILNFDFLPEILKPFQFCVNRQQRGYIAVHEMTHLIYFYFIVDGCGEVITKEKSRKFKKGDIICVFPKTQCKFNFFTKENRWDWISAEFGKRGENGALLIPARLKGGITEVLEALEREAAYSEERPYQVLSMLYGLLDEAYVDAPELFADQSAGARDSQSVAKAVDYIGLNYYHKIDINSICTYVNYSRYYFSRRFKEIQGMSITEYINKVRLDRAVYLLTHTDLTVIQVARSVGFEDPYYFSKKFKLYTGLAPTQFKSAYQ